MCPPLFLVIFWVEEQPYVQELENHTGISVVVVK